MKKNLLLALSMTCAVVASAGVIDNRYAAVSPASPVKAQAVQISRQATPLAAMGATFAENLRRAAATTAPGTYYARPHGTFYTGISESFAGYKVNLIQYGPAFAEWKFTNVTPEEEAVPTYKWNYVDPTVENTDLDNQPWIQSSNKDLAVTYTTGLYQENPKLTATNELGDSTYSFAVYMQAGGGCYKDQEGKLFYGTNANSSDGGLYYNPTQTGLNNDEANQKIVDFYYDNKVDAVKVTGIAEYNEAPAAPYLLTDMYFIYDASKTKDASGNTPKEGDKIGQARLTIYKASMDEEGRVTKGDQICTNVTDVLMPAPNYYSMVVFRDLLTLNEFQLEEPLVIDCPILVVVSPENSDKMTLVPTWTPCKAKKGERQAFMVADVTANGNTVEDIIDCNWKYKAGYATAWGFGYNLSYEYIHNTEATDKFDAPKGGGSKEFRVRARYLSQNPSDGTSIWSITDTEGNELPDWLTVNVADQMVDQSGQKYYSGNSTIKITAAPLPDGEENRTCDVEFSYPGAKLVLHVGQPYASGVNSVDTQKQISAVKYVNMLGQESATPFEGINIVTTTYSDGSQATSKVIK